MTTESDLHNQNIRLHKLNQATATELAGSFERITDRFLDVLKKQQQEIEQLRFRLEYLEKRERMDRESKRLKVIH